MNNNKNKPVVLCIMDGWGINQSSDFNAVTLAKTPNKAKIYCNKYVIEGAFTEVKTISATVPNLKTSGAIFLVKLDIKLFKSSRDLLQ